MGYQAGVGIGLGPDGLTNAQRTAQQATPQTQVPAPELTPLQQLLGTPEQRASGAGGYTPRNIVYRAFDQLGGEGKYGSTTYNNPQFATDYANYVKDDPSAPTYASAFPGQAAQALTPTQLNPMQPQTQALQGTSQGATGSANSYEQALENALTPSADETKYTSQLDALNSQMAGVNASRDLGIQGVNEQPIATPFLTGESAAVTNRAATQVGALSAQATPLKDQLAQAQARRQSAIDVAKAGLDYQQNQQSAAQHLADQQFTASQNQLSRDATSDATKYSTATAGSEVYNAKTGEVVNGGAVAPKVATTPAGLASGGTYTSGSLKVTPDMYSQGKTTLLDTKATDAKGNPNRGTDGWSNPAIYLGLLHDFITNGGTQADFLKLYPVNTYINPKNTMSQIVALGGGTKPKTTTVKKTSTSSGAQLP